MCFGSKSTTTYVSTPQQSVSTNQKPQWVTNAGQALYSKATALADQPYTPYQGPRIAGFTGEENQAFDMAKGNVGNYKPELNQASGLMGASTQQANYSNLQPYMNPFQQAVIDRNLQENTRQGQIAINQINANAAQSGAFGGSRHGIVEALQRRDEGLRATDIANQGNLQNFQQAQNQFNNERNRYLQAGSGLAGLAGSRQQMAHTDAANLAGIGQGKRDMSQANLDLAYGDYITQREAPWRNLNMQMAALQGTPYESQNFGTQMAKQTPIVQNRGSTFGNVVGGLGMLGSTMNAFKGLF